MFMNGIFYVLNKIGIPNIGLAIIIMTILIYMAMLPLTVKQQKFSKLQRKMQPELNKINKKYEGRKDPESMERQQAEIKEVYGKYGVSATVWQVRRFRDGQLRAAHYPDAYPACSLQGVLQHSRICSYGQESFLPSCRRIDHGECR